MDVSKVLFVRLGGARPVSFVRVRLGLGLDMHMIAAHLFGILTDGAFLHLGVVLRKYCLFRLLLHLFLHHLFIQLRLGLHQKVHVLVVAHYLNVILLLLYCLDFSLNARIHGKIYGRLLVEHQSGCLSRLILGHLLK